MAAVQPFDPVAHLRRYLLEGLSRSANVPFFAPDEQDPLLQPPPRAADVGAAAAAAAVAAAGGAEDMQDIDEYSSLIPNIAALPPTDVKGQLEQYFGNVTTDPLTESRDIDGHIICLLYKTPDALNGTRVMRGHAPFVFTYINENNGGGESELIKSIFGNVHYTIYSLDAFVNAALRTTPPNLVAKPTFTTFVEQTLKRADPILEVTAVVAGAQQQAFAVADALPTGVLYLGTSSRTRPEHVLKALEPFPYSNHSPWYGGVRYETVAAMAKKRCLFPRRNPTDDEAANLFVGLFVDAFVRTVLLIHNLRKTVSQTNSAICRDILERCCTSSKKNSNGNASVRFYNRVARYGCETDWWVGMNMALSVIASNNKLEVAAANHVSTTLTNFVTKATHPANSFAATFADHDMSRVARYGRGDYSVKLFKRKCTAVLTRALRA